MQIGEYKQIGSTQNLKEREYHHLNLLTQNKHYNKYLQRVYNKYNKVTFKILYSFTTRKEAYQKEQELLNKYYSTPNYTMGSAVACGGSLPGIEANMYRKKHSEEAKRKISEGNKGKKVSQEAKEKLREVSLGKVTCRNANGQFLKVSKEEFDKRPDLVGCCRGISKPNARKKVQCIETGEVYNGVVQAGRILKVPPGQISQNLKGTRLKVGVKSYIGGLTFKLEV